MPDDFRLKAQARDLLGSRNSRRLRKGGLVPANLYGFKKESLNLTIPADDVERMVANKSRVVDVEVDGTVDKAVVRELQWDIYSTYIKHVDLQRVDVDKMAAVEVPVALRGEPLGLKDGGQLRQLVKYVKITCPEFRIPKRLVARVTPLQIGDSLKVSDLEVPETIKVETDGSDVVVELFDPKKVAAAEESTAE